MPSWKEVLLHLTANTEDRMDELRYRLHSALGGPGPVKIVAYHGFGTPSRLFVKGRVLEDKHIPEAEQNDNLWENLVNMYKRLETDEVPHARLALRFQDAEQVVQADEEGFFETWIEPNKPLVPHRLWHPVEIELLEPVPTVQARYPVMEVAQVLVPPDTTRFAVISDIDDTILKSDAAHLLRMARNVFLGNAHTRLPFTGVAALYRALFGGLSGAEMNPLFYVSSSPWNLYDLLVQFFNLQGIPIGPVLFLRDWGITEHEILPIHNREYKLAAIQQIMQTYQTLPFVLIGDSGQEDPEIYAETVRQNPGRVLAVYIRNVSRDLKRPEAIRELARRVVEDGSALVLAEDSVAIAQHAIEKSLIPPSALPLIREERRKDEAPPEPLNKLLGEETAPHAQKQEGPTVKIESRHPEEVKEAVKQGVIEETIQKAGDKDTQKPATVVVETKK